MGPISRQLAQAGLGLELCAWTCFVSYTKDPHVDRFLRLASHLVEKITNHCRKGLVSS